MAPAGGRRHHADRGQRARGGHPVGGLPGPGPARGEIGTPLLRRPGRTLRTTQAGAVFKPHLDALLHKLDDGIAAVSQLIEPDTGRWRWPSSSRWAPGWSRNWSAASAPRPRGRVPADPGRGTNRTVDLDGGNADLELGSRRAPDEATCSRLIAVEPLRLALPRDHPLARTAGPAGRGGGRAVHRPVRGVRAAAADRRALPPGGVPSHRDLRGRRPVQRPGFVAAGLGVAVVPAPRAGSPEAVPGPVTYLEILDEGAAREIFLTWSAERRLPPATDLFRRHSLSRAAMGRLPAVALYRTGRARAPQPGDDVGQDVDALDDGGLADGGVAEDQPAGTGVADPVRVTPSIPPRPRPPRRPRSPRPGPAAAR